MCRIDSLFKWEPAVLISLNRSIGFSSFYTCLFVSRATKVRESKKSAYFIEVHRTSGPHFRLVWVASPG